MAHSNHIARVLFSDCIAHNERACHLGRLPQTRLNLLVLSPFSSGGGKKQCKHKLHVRHDRTAASSFQGRWCHFVHNYTSSREWIWGIVLKPAGQNFYFVQLNNRRQVKRQQVLLHHCVDNENQSPQVSASFPYLLDYHSKVFMKCYYYSRTKSEHLPLPRMHMKRTQ